MVNAEYSDYVNKVLRLVRSMVIKYDRDILSVNDGLKIRGESISIYKEEWKYFKNLNGDYYEGDVVKDELMWVKSLDRGIPIPFTKESLGENPLTLREYRLRTGSFRSLMATYPKNIQLISGIIQPLPFEEVSGRQNFTILSYDTSLVEGNEYTLLEELQDWLYRLADRWENDSFSVTDPLYPASLFSVTVAQLPLAIINLRLKRCKTKEAHSYHLWNYLAGYFSIDEFKANIPIDTAMYLYRNIARLTVNAGTTETLDDLITNIANPNGLTIKKFHLESRYGQTDDKLSPRTLTAFTSDYLEGASTSVETPLTPLAKRLVLKERREEQELAELNNESVKPSVVQMPTGVLHCSSSEELSGLFFDESRVRLSTFETLVFNSLFTATFELPLGGTSVGNTRVSAQDTLRLLVYITMKLNGEETATVPRITARGVLGQTSGIGGVLGTSYSQELLEDIQGDIEWHSAVNDYRDFDNIIAFLKQRKLRHVLSTGFSDTSLDRGMVRHLVSSMYGDATAPESFKEDVEILSARLNFYPNSLDEAELADILVVILKGIGLPLVNSAGLGSPQLEIKEIIKRLVSYMTVFTESTGRSDTSPLSYANAMLDNIRGVVSTTLTGLQPGVPLRNRGDTLSTMIKVQEAAPAVSKPKAAVSTFIKLPRPSRPKTTSRTVVRTTGMISTLTLTNK